LRQIERGLVSAGYLLTTLVSIRLKNSHGCNDQGDPGPGFFFAGAAAA